MSSKIINNVDIVIHQAARGSIPKSIKNPIGTNNDNITGFLNVINCSRENNIKSFVYTCNNPSEIKLFWDAGLSGVITDDPLRFK